MAYRVSVEIHIRNGNGNFLRIARGKFKPIKEGEEMEAFNDSFRDALGEVHQYNVVGGKLVSDVVKTREK
jgi:hypothetical protein